MQSPTPLTEQIATIVADCKLEGTSANETTRQILEVFTTLTTQHTKEKEELVREINIAFEEACNIRLGNPTSLQLASSFALKFKTIAKKHNITI